MYKISFCMSVPPFEQRYKIGINKGLMGFFMLSQVVERSSHKILNFKRPAFNFLNVYLVNSSFVSLNILEVELLQEVVDGLVHVLRQHVLLAAPVGSSRSIVLQGRRGRGPHHFGGSTFIGLRRGRGELRFQESVEPRDLNLD